MNNQIDIKSQEPLYKQMVSQIERGIREGRMTEGEALPSMNEMAAHLGISKETVKKAYRLLTDRGVIIPKQGKGFYVAGSATREHLRILLLFDKISDYKQTLYNAFIKHLGKDAEIPILVHNQNPVLLKAILDYNLDLFDYYVLTPHFLLDKKNQALAVKQMARIPNRKLIMLDHLQPNFPGNYGAVYQDFENDIYDSLRQELDAFRNVRHLIVITLPQSLYGPLVQKGVKRFSDEFRIPVEFRTTIPDEIHKGETFLLLNSQLDSGVVELSRKIRQTDLAIGTDVRIISYNDIDMNELVLGGLTSVSTDFREMGRLAAEMILTGHPVKVHCPFRMIRRSTF